MNTRPAIDESTGPVALAVAFNQDSSCFAVGLDTGFCVFNSDPCELKVSRDFNAGIGAAEMLGRANYVALVGGGKNPKFPTNKVGKLKTRSLCVPWHRRLMESRRLSSGMTQSNLLLSLSSSNRRSFKHGYPAPKSWSPFLTVSPYTLSPRHPRKSPHSKPQIILQVSAVWVRTS